MKKTVLSLILLALLALCGCDSCQVVRVADGKLHFSDYKTTDIPHWNDPEWTIFFFVRHAEKLDQSDNPDLSPEGYARAAKLGGIMENAGLNLVFATDKLRTQKTAEAVVIRAHTSPWSLYPREVAAETAWLQSQLTENRGKRIMVVGHSNTVPRMINKLMGPGTNLTDLNEENFSAFFVVASRGLGQSELISKRY
jgi:phosphohistidine phosphatase SixA